MAKEILVLLKVPLPLLLFILMECVQVDSQSYENATDLKTSLLTSYDADIIPLNNQSEVINICVTLLLYSQPDVDPIRGSISTALVLSSYWIDERITWTPAQYNGIENLNIKNSAVWSPSISIAQSMTFEPLSGSGMRIKFTSAGFAEFTPGDVYETSCKFNMKYWPFDKHACYLTFVSVDYTMDKMKIVANNISVSTQYYIQNGGWFLKTDSIPYRIGVNNPPTITYRLIYERQPTFYILTIIIPMNGIGALNCFAFLIPTTERIDFSLTIMLSLSVFLTVITDELPKQGDPVPIMCVYILFATLFSMVSTVIVIFNNFLYERDTAIPISSPYKLILKISRLGRNRIESKQNGIENSQNKIKATDLQAVKKERSDNTVISEADNTENLTWQEVGKAVDKIMFCALFVVITITPTIIIICLAAVSEHEEESIFWTF